MESLGCTVLFTGRVIYMWARVLVWRSSDDSADEGKWSTDDVLKSCSDAPPAESLQLLAALAALLI